MTKPRGSMAALSLSRSFRANRCGGLHGGLRHLLLLEPCALLSQCVESPSSFVISRRGYLTKAVADDVARDHAAFAAIVAHVTDIEGAPDPEALQAAVACCHSEGQLSDLAAVYSSLRRRGVSLSTFETRLFVLACGRFGAFDPALSLVSDCLRDTMDPSPLWRDVGHLLTWMAQSPQQLQRVVTLFGPASVASGLMNSASAGINSFTVTSSEDATLLLLCLEHGNASVGAQIVAQWASGGGEQLDQLLSLLRSTIVSPVVTACEAAESINNNSRRRKGLASIFGGRGPSALVQRILAGGHPLVTTISSPPDATVELSSNGGFESAHNAPRQQHSIPVARPHVVATLAALGWDQAVQLFDGHLSGEQAGERLRATVCAASAATSGSVGSSLSGVLLLPSSDPSRGVHIHGSDHFQHLTRASLHRLLDSCSHAELLPSVIINDAQLITSFVTAASNAGYRMDAAVENSLYACMATVLDKISSNNLADGIELRVERLLRSVVDLFCLHRLQSASSVSSPCLDAAVAQLLILFSASEPLVSQSLLSSLLADASAALQEASNGNCSPDTASTTTTPTGGQRSLYGDASVAVLQSIAYDVSVGNTSKAAPPLRLHPAISSFPPVYSDLPPPPYLFEGPQQYDPLGFTRNLLFNAPSSTAAGANADRAGFHNNGSSASRPTWTEAEVTQLVRGRLRERAGFLTGHDHHQPPQQQQRTAGKAAAADADSALIVNDSSPATIYQLVSDPLLRRAIEAQGLRSAALLSSQGVADGLMAAAVALLRGRPIESYAAGLALDATPLETAVMGLLENASQLTSQSGLSLLLQVILSHWRPSSSPACDISLLKLIAAAVRAEAASGGRAVLLNGASLSSALQHLLPPPSSPPSSSSSRLGHIASLPADAVIALVERWALSGLLRPHCDRRQELLLDASYSALLEAASTGSLPPLRWPSGDTDGDSSHGTLPSPPLLVLPEVQRGADVGNIATAIVTPSGSSSPVTLLHSTVDSPSYWALRALMLATARLSVSGSSKQSLLTHHPRLSKRAGASVAWCGSVDLQALLAMHPLTSPPEGHSSPLTASDYAFAEGVMGLLLSQGQLPAALGLYWTLRQQQQQAASSLSFETTSALFSSCCAAGLVLDALAVFSDLITRLDSADGNDHHTGPPPSEWYSSVLHSIARLLGDLTVLARRTRLSLRAELVERALGGGEGGGGVAVTDAVSAAVNDSSPASPRVPGKLGSHGRGSRTPVKTGLHAVTTVGDSGAPADVITCSSPLLAPLRLFSLGQRLLPANDSPSSSCYSVGLPLICSPLVLVTPAAAASNPATFLAAGCPSDVSSYDGDTTAAGDVITAGRRRSSLLTSLFPSSLSPLTGPAPQPSPSPSGFSGAEWHHHGADCLDTHVFRLSPTGRLIAAYLQAAVADAPYTYPPRVTSTSTVSSSRSDGTVDRDALMRAWRLRSAAMSLASDLMSDVQLLVQHFARAHATTAATVSNRDGSSRGLNGSNSGGRGYADLPSSLQAALLEVARATGATDVAVDTYVRCAAADEGGASLTSEVADVAIQTVCASVPSAYSQVHNWLTYDATPQQLTALAQRTEERRQQQRLTESAGNGRLTLPSGDSDDSDCSDVKDGDVATVKSTALLPAHISPSRLSPEELALAGRVLTAFESFLAGLEGSGPPDRSNPLHPSEGGGGMPLTGPAAGSHSRGEIMQRQLMLQHAFSSDTLQWSTSSPLPPLRWQPPSYLDSASDQSSALLLRRIVRQASSAAGTAPSAGCGGSVSHSDDSDSDDVASPSSSSPSSSSPLPARWLGVALDMYAHARSRGLALSHSTYTSLLSACGRRMAARPMTAIYDDLRASGVMPLGMPPQLQRGQGRSAKAQSQVQSQGGL